MQRLHMHKVLTATPWDTLKCVLCFEEKFELVGDMQYSRKYMTHTSVLYSKDGVLHIKRHVSELLGFTHICKTPSLSIKHITGLCLT